MLSNKWTTSGVTNFGRWDYPLGVTMYGLLQSGRQLERPDIVSYAAAISRLYRRYEYSFWDRQQYGFPAINQQLVMMRMLDNCGSFGSAMLEAYAECEDPGLPRDCRSYCRFYNKPAGTQGRRGFLSENASEIIRKIRCGQMTFI